MTRRRVGIIYGGRSGEHEVSLASAAAVFANLDPARYEPIPIRIGRDGRWTRPPAPPGADSAAAVIAQARRGAAAADEGPELLPLARPGRVPMVELEPAAAAALGEDVRARLTGLALDVVFPVLHGPYGEDGTLQGLLELANVPYVGAGVLASALAMDKAMARLVFAARGLPHVASLLVLRNAWRADPGPTAARIERELGFPVFVKPANLGSSVGISKAASRAELAAAVALAAEFDRRIVVEAAVPGAREIECAVLGNDRPDTSIPGEIVPSRDFYDYEAKYVDEGSRLLIAAPLTDTQAADVRRLAVDAYQAIDCAGMARVDFLMERATGRLYVNEINTIPGFTTISMYAKLWAATGLAYPVLLDRLIAFALERHAEKQDLRTSLS